MRHSLDGDRFQRGISQDNFLVALRRWVALIGGVDVLPKHLAHPRQLRHETAQNVIRPFFRRLVWRNFSQASAKFVFESGLQISYSSPSGLGQIFGTHQRFTAKTGKHQTHQLSASRLDGETRGESGGSVQIINAASLAVSLKQFVNCVTSRRFHHRNYATASSSIKRETRERCSAKTLKREG